MSQGLTMLTYHDDGHRYTTVEYNTLGLRRGNAGKLRIRGYEYDALDNGGKGRYRWVKTFVHRHGQTAQSVHDEARQWCEIGNRD